MKNSLDEAAGKGKSFYTMSPKKLQAPVILKTIQPAKDNDHHLHYPHLILEGNVQMEKQEVRRLKASVASGRPG